MNIELPNNFSLYSYDSIDSTNEEAKRLLQDMQGECHKKIICTAKTQTGGKGSKGRSWISDEGNLFFSIGFFDDTRKENIFQFSYLAAIILHKLFSQIIDDKNSIKLKWPNDILINNKKIAGILAENLNYRYNKSLNIVIIGIGVNIKSYPANNIRFPAGCLDEILQEKKLNMAEFLKKFINLFEIEYYNFKNNDFDIIRNYWISNSYGLNKKVNVIVNNKIYSGIYKNIGMQGEFIVDCNKERMKFLAADIEYLD